MLNDLLKDKLRVLAEDDLTMEAIRQVAILQIEKLKPSIDETIDNMVLGEKFRAVEESYKLFNSVLKDIASYKGKRSSKEIINKGI